MANQIESYFGLTVTPVTDGVQIPVPLTPAGVGLAEVRVDVPATFPQVVELKATIGLRGDVGTGSVLFRIFRDGQVIYYARQGIESGFEKYYVPTIQAIDVNPPAGSHGYTLSIESLTAGLTAVVIGPITLSALVINAL
ncbi:exosporium protein C [Paenibacillus alginolyticus]|uniref:Exosporium protein C n=1 Tax=Paenibacillus alginolyticus TaxID=59839 RepID=A0ABT4G5Q9_9BACL|nr:MULTISPECIES: exosporium protein C [Paenibacillus]MCY9691507.1 exosporium protein C [Paenibacillus alginolyticus]MEC0148793.1 exosporium protein C [Paenibacillus alginolyticus]NRF93850.1 exosporium protein C [Paenibacillus frigoriresistens]